MAAPVLKGGRAGSRFGRRVLTGPPPVIQVMISQVIIGYRAWAITRRSKELGIFLLSLGAIVTVLEWYSNVDARIAVQDEVSARGDMRSVNSAPDGGCHFYAGKVRRSVHAGV